jgi:hypothetical protein
LFDIFKNVCACLPCQDCTNHAKQYLKTIRFQNIQTKEQFKSVLFAFHNAVNARTHKPHFTNYDMYKASKLKNIFLVFKEVYIKNYILNRGFMDTLYRRNVIHNIESFLNTNKNSFIWL